MFFKVLGASSIFLSYLCVSLTITPTDACANNLQDTQNRKTTTAQLLSIKILGEDDLSGLYKINEHGEITLPLIGTILIKGQTESHIESLLTHKFQQGYLLDPIITVQKINKDLSEKQPAPQTETQPQKTSDSIYILGSVENPGRYILPKDANHILKVIALAGGFKGSAHAKKYEIMRNNVKISFVKNTYTPQSGDIIIVKEHYFWAGNK